MSDPVLDVVAIGNAIVDVVSPAPDELLERHGLVKGSMRLVERDEAALLYADMPPGVEVSGGSAANTCAGLASLGGRAGFIGKVADDQMGELFTHDIRAAGVEFTIAPLKGGPPTGRCLILVTPDAQRTMSTLLGAATQLAPADVADAAITQGDVVYLEGYLWDPPEAKEAFRKAMGAAHGAGRRVALTLSDSFCVDRYRRELRQLVESDVDILFGNEDEVTGLFEVAQLDQALAVLEGCGAIAAVTRGAQGSVVIGDGQRHVVAAAPVTEVVDTTGAGDLYAAGLLYGLTHGYGLDRAGELASLCAAEVISHMGARPQHSLAALATEAGLLP